MNENDSVFLSGPSILSGKLCVIQQHILFLGIKLILKSVSPLAGASSKRWKVFSLYKGFENQVLVTVHGLSGFFFGMIASLSEVQDQQSSHHRRVYPVPTMCWGLIA